MDIAEAGFRIDAPRTLGVDEVHLWRVDLAATAGAESQWSAILSSEERDRAARFHFPRDRQYFVAARAILRRVLGGYVNVDPETLMFVYSSKEKPALGGAHADTGLHFNISHSGDVALFACTLRRQVGVDVEQIRSQRDTAVIAARFFSPAEQEQLASIPQEERVEAFFRCWTRKEAYIKATGEGLSLPLREFDVSLAPRSQNALLATRTEASEAKRWSLRDITVKPGYAAALCVVGTGWNLVDWSGSESHV